MATLACTAPVTGVHRSQVAKARCPACGTQGARRSGVIGKPARAVAEPLPTLPTSKWQVESIYANVLDSGEATLQASLSNGSVMVDAELTFELVRDGDEWGWYSYPSVALQPLCHHPLGIDLSDTNLTAASSSLSYSFHATHAKGVAHLKELFETKQHELIDEVMSDRDVSCAIAAWQLADRFGCEVEEGAGGLEPFDTEEAAIDAYRDAMAGPLLKVCPQTKAWQLTEQGPMIRCGHDDELDDVAPFCARHGADPETIPAVDQSLVDVLLLRPWNFNDPFTMFPYVAERLGFDERNEAAREALATCAWWELTSESPEVDTIRIMHPNP